MGAPERVTIKSIAQELGVSFSTVAKALNGDPNISQQTRELVERKAKEMNYTRNYFAQNLRHKGSKTVAIIMDVIDAPVFAEILAMISTELAAHGYTTLVSDSRHSEEAERNCIQSILSRMPEAIIISMSDPSSKNLELLQPMFSSTLVLGTLGSSAKTSFLSLGHRRAGYLSAQHMLSRGNHRNLIFCNSQGNQAGQLFLQGVRDAYAEQGIPLNDDDIYAVTPYAEDAAQQFSGIWKERHGQLDGVICDCDSMAFGIYHASRELGLVIPDDISVIGYDDSYLNNFTDPPLTAIHMPRDQVVKHCSQFLLGRLLEGDRELHAYQLEPHLVERSSVAQRT